jgi:hypothetical protein
MERHKNRAGQVSDENGEDARKERLAEDRRGERSGDDGEHIQIRTKPKREQLTRVAVPLIERDLIDSMLFDARRFSIAVHGLYHVDGRNRNRLGAIARKSSRRYCFDADGDIGCRE